jgi:hypothetical protein
MKHGHNSIILIFNLLSYQPIPRIYFMDFGFNFSVLQLWYTIADNVKQIKVQLQILYEIPVIVMGLF